MAELTLKQKKFCDLYLELGNATEAAIQAGYSKKTAKSIGQENLTKPDIKTYIETRLKEIEDAKIASITEVMQYLTRGIRQELEEEVVVVEGIGNGMSEARTIKKKISIKDSNKCAEMLAKRFGILTDKVVLETTPIVIKDDVPDDD